MNGLYISPSLVPEENLALEEYLLARAADRSIAFLLYRNAPCVVIGKHQNPWKECDVEQAQTRGVEIRRRASGGGTVYHDPGNLNYSFIMDRELYHREDVFSVILGALSSLGIGAQRENKSDIFLSNKKISGTSFFYSRNRVLHHGTLLVNADLEKIASLLTPHDTRHKTRAVASTPSPVANIAAGPLGTDAGRKSVTLAGMQEALVAACKRRFTGAWTSLQTPDAHDPAFVALVQKYSSRDWIFGATPAFDIEFSRPDSAYTISLGLHVENGVIREARADFIEADREFASRVEKVLAGLAYEKQKVMAAFEKASANDPEEIGRRGLIAWIRGEKF